MNRHILVLILVLNGLGCSRAGSNDVLMDPGILAEVNGIRAIDNHAHPVRVVGKAEQPDRDFDALPVDNMEPSSDPIQMRPTDPALLVAGKALWNYPYDDMKPEHVQEWRQLKQRVVADKGEGYPAWILDRLGVDVMLGNRVRMGPSVDAPRFRWVPYADALLFPLDNTRLAQKNSDRKSFFALEDKLMQRYLAESSITTPPRSLDEYLKTVVTPTLERHKQGGAVAEKFEAAYLRSLAFDKVDRADADRVYAGFIGKASPPDDDYKRLQDFLFRFIAAECGRLGMAVHLHTMAGAGSYFEVAGVNPLLLEPVLNDPELRKTKFVMVHGGWPFIRQIAALLTKPNAYLDFSQQSMLLSPATLAQSIREWLEFVPEKVLFATDGYPYSSELGWEESAWIGAKRGREALTMALTAMVRDQEISRERAMELARLVLRENARSLYGF